jgi:hypothetical protein
MSGFEAVLTVVVGLLVRFAVPIALTIFAVWFFRRLDRRWQAEAQERTQLQIALTTAKRTPCWEQKKCSEESRASCPVYAQKNLPCWQVLREKDGNLKPACLDCGVFRDAPMPVKL